MGDMRYSGKTTSSSERPGLKELVLEVFGSRDGLTPLFPRSGEKIQESMEKAYDLGRKSERK